MPRTINDAQAYYIFESRDIDRAGVTDVEQFLKRSLPMQTTANSAAQSFFIGGSVGSINLRGLGNNQTLVLLNGRRGSAGNLSLNGGGGLNGFDLNTIPLSAIDRIEVLPTTASAIYGASAVGGVINIILKRRYAGGEIKATYQNPDDTDAPMRKIDLNYGLSLEGGRTQVMIAAGYSDQKVIQSQDREFMLADYRWQVRQNRIAASGTMENWLGATPNIINSSATASLTLKPAYGGGSIGSSLTFIPYGVTPSTPLATIGAALRANAGQVNRDAPDTRQILNGRRADHGVAPRLKSLLVTGRREMTPWLELNGEFMLTSSASVRNMTIINSQSVPATAPWNPFTSQVTVAVPISGDWPVWSNNVTRRITAGALVRLPHDWIAQADFTWTQADNAYYNTTFASQDVTADLNAGVLNPFLDTTLFPYDLSRYVGIQSWTGQGTMNNAALRLAGPLMRLPAGSPRVAIGLERRQDGFKNGNQYSTFANFPARNSHTLALGKKSSIESAYIEANIPVLGETGVAPLVRDLNVQLAWRLEDYSVHTGTSSVAILPAPAMPPVIRSNQTSYKSSNPTFGFTYRPVKSLMLRASYSEGFVPPTYSQLTEPLQAANPSNVSDRRRGGALTSIFTVAGGNPDLVPESSKSTSVGLVLEPASGPLKGLRLGVDYVFIDKLNNIATLSAQVLVDNESNFPDRITRDPVAPGDPFGVGRITSVNTSSVNLLRALNEAVDVSLRFRRTTDRWGSFDLNALGTFGLKYARKTVINTPFVDYAGYTGNPLTFNGTATAIWDYKRLSLGWTSRYIPKLHVLGPPVSVSLSSRQGQGGEWVPAQTYHDIFGSYRFPMLGTVSDADDRPIRRRLTARLLSGLELQLAVYNVFRKIPPLDNSSFPSYSYSVYGDVRLRDIRISVKKPF